MSYSILDTIGNTPLVEIKSLNPNPKVRILAKTEYFNPGGSVKDRIALSMIEAGEKSGELTPEKTVIEATSGNTGIGLAMVCGVKGYKLLLTMSEAVSVERQKILKARGAEIFLTPGHLGTDGAIEEVYNLARENPESYFMADQFNNAANWKAHYYGTAQEIWEQTDGKVTMVVATLGTSGTVMGISRRLKELNPAIRIVAVEPYLGHKIQGLKNMKEAYRPEIFDKKRLDAIINIDDEEAFEMTRRLAKEEGLFVGMSSGAAMVIACKQAETLPEGTIVVILPDGGERYLSTPLFAVREKVDLQLFNTMSRSKESFEPLHEGKVAMFSCGPTAHARLHVSECRRFVFSDLLCSYLEYRGYAVTHVMNITDLDDKTIDGSEKARLEIGEFTAKNIEGFKKDLDALGIKPAQYPLASQHVDDMVLLAEKLLKKGFAYEKLRSLYFDISRFPDYGKLSGIDIDKIRLGATVDLDEYEKDNPRDFTLLKRSRLSELKRGIYTKTEWGNVRPSWHIQSVAMAMKYLGESYDIHTSSRELVFPHNENEIAIAGAVTGKPLAKYWVHCDRVLVEGKKVDEHGSGLTLSDLASFGYSNRVIRCWLLSAHYRKPVTFTKKRLENAGRSLERLDTCIHTLHNVRADALPYPELDQLLYDLKHGFVSAMDDDLNISAAMASIFKIVKRINVLTLENRLDRDGALKVVDGFRNIDTVLKIFNFEDEVYDPEVQRLIKERDKARLEKNWDLADKIRDQLRGLDINVKDRRVVS
ncbi:MAG: cysteine--tRNA ligase [Desulfobacterales bacterium]|uniref:Cysteine--tRNA ligase n=1 Tax=Candidatus Desulfatibia vada TaxID=2841696 RepID=A0A8J6P2X3_9BACT|nr:cysteine--tRNA ligase [Candidatus Desulfatibia vada]